MGDRAALLLAWLEGEGERRRRPVLPPPQANDPAPRGWAQLGACALAGALAVGLFVCALAAGRDRAMQVNCMEQLRLAGFLRAAGEPNWQALPTEWWKGEGATAGRNGGALGVILCLMVLAMALGTVIGAVLLLAACTLYNKLAGGTGSPNSVPEPLLPKALGIIVGTILVNAVLGFVIAALVGAGGAAAGARERGPAVVIAQLLSLPVGLLVLAGMNSALLPTTFARGLLVALCYLLVALFAVVVLAVLFGGLSLLATAPR